MEAKALLTRDSDTEDNHFNHNNQLNALQSY